MNSIQVSQVFFVLVFCVPAILAYFLTHFSIALCNRFKFFDYPEGRKEHLRPMPFLGGLAVFAAFWITVGCSFLIVDWIGQKPYFLHLLDTSLSGLPGTNMRLFWVFVGACVIWVVGFLDDQFYWTPAQKILGQLFAALILWKLGLSVNLFPVFGWAGEGMTLVWILLIINAFNLIDSIDGHCAGVAMVSCFTFYWITQLTQQPLISFFLAAFAGSLFGFLPHNFKPATVFLGDNGSLFIGYMMAAFTLLCRFENPEITQATFFVPIMAFGVPIYDTLSVILARTLRGVPPWKGDRNHFAHRLVKIGMDQDKAVIFSYLTSVTLGITAVLMTQVNLFGAILTGLLFLSIIAIVAFMEFYAVTTIRRIEKAELRKEN